MIQKFEFTELELKGAYLIQPFCATDDRGAFVKDYSAETLKENGIQHDLKEVFYTISKRGVIRAMHFQRVMQQAKLVRCVHGHIYDVVLDLRKDSKTFKKWLAFDLTGENHKEILVPAGCAHGYLVLEDSIVSYKCDEKFYAEYDDGIVWNDPNFAIAWPVDKIGGIDKIILSDKDLNLQTFEQFMDVYGGF